MDREALNARLLQLFVDELDEQVQAMNTDLLALEAGPEDAERIRSLFRVAHTLKGAARAAGVPSIETACHSLEDRLAEIRDERRAITPQEVEILYRAADFLQEASRRLRAGQSVEGDDSESGQAQKAGEAASTTQASAAVSSSTSGDVAATVDSPAVPAVDGPEPHPSATVPSVSAPQANERQVEQEAPSSAEGAPEPEESSADSERADPGASDPSGDFPDTHGEAPPAPATLRGIERRTLRIEAERLDDLLATAGEVLGLGRRADDRRQVVEELADSVEQWAREWHRDLPRLLETLERGGAAAAERETAASVGERLRQLGEETRTLARNSALDARQLSRAGDGLTGQVRHLRMRPITDAAETLPRAVRDLAAEAGKEVRLEVEGTGVEVDRAVLDAVREALLPLVRNAIDHGIEPPDERERLGKPRVATLGLRAELRGDRVVVTLWDDGSGIDESLLRQRYTSAGVKVKPGPAGLVDALLGGGVSSRSSATVISGRGVGLDIVRATMERVRGTVNLDWDAGSGTRIRLEFPPSLASLRALLVSVGPQVLGLPTTSVERIVRVRVDELSTLEGRTVLRDASGPIPLLSLGAVLGPPLVERPLAGVARTIVVSAGDERAAFVVDDLLVEDELILRPVPVGGYYLPLIAGAAILGDGAVVPVIDAAALLATALRAAPSHIHLSESAPGAARRRILIADDSLTTRTLEQSVLDAAGFVTATAVDGLDALRLLQAQPFDLVVSDVEMPRLDGFGLCESIRASAALRETPVILVTARESADDRARGMESGADAYLLKSSFDQEELLATIEQLLG